MNHRSFKVMNETERSISIKLEHMSFLGNHRSYTGTNEMEQTIKKWEEHAQLKGTERTIQKKENSPSPGLTNILW